MFRCPPKMASCSAVLPSSPQLEFTLTISFAEMGDQTTSSLPSIDAWSSALLSLLLSLSQGVRALGSRRTGEELIGDGDREVVEF